MNNRLGCDKTKWNSNEFREGSNPCSFELAFAITQAKSPQNQQWSKQEIGLNLCCFKLQSIIPSSHQQHQHLATWFAKVHKAQNNISEHGQMAEWLRR
jgi:hypothetical protein